MKTFRYLVLLIIAALALVAASCGPKETGENHAFTEEQARQKAEEFVRNSPTFTFDGMEETLVLTETLYPDIPNAWQFVYDFDSRQSGYGDREGQMLLQVITPHEAVVTVENGEITAALMDGQWDMLRQVTIEDEEMLVSSAPIHNVEVVFMESFPVQVGVKIEYGLRDGCTTFHESAVTRDGNEITIEITTRRPVDAICDMAYRFGEEYVNLGSDFTEGTTYTLKVNEVTTEFKY